MPSVRYSKVMGTLFLDFRYKGQRFREYTALSDTQTNRKALQRVLAKIDADIRSGSFEYGSYFPNSKALERLQAAGAMQHPSDELTPLEVAEPSDAQAPTFVIYAERWYEMHRIEWRRSYAKSVRSTLDSRLIPQFKDKGVSSITRSDILNYRATLGKVDRGSRGVLSNKRINEIIGVLCRILSEAADEWQFTSPALRVKRLRVRKVDVQPFSLDEVRLIISSVRADYRHYFTVRILTGMRTGEVHGLKWSSVDFAHRLILVRETYVLGHTEYTKTDGSQRDIQMSEPVYQALQEQYRITGGRCDYVFCNREGLPLDNKNFTDRVWYPLLRHLGLESRRPYQMRHTAATLWLASGEAPEWIARQLGHTSTEMLFRVYSRYVPNLTRQDGSAMDRLLATRLATGRLVPLDGQQRGELELVRERVEGEPEIYRANATMRPHMNKARQALGGFK